LLFFQRLSKMGMDNITASPRKRRKLSKESYLENEESLEEGECIETSPGEDVPENITTEKVLDEPTPPEVELDTILEPIMDIISGLRLKGKQVDKDFSSLTSLIEQHWKKTRPNTEEKFVKQCLRGFIGNSVAEAFPRLTITLHLYGSSACGLDSKGDDIDLGIEFIEKNKPSDKEVLSIVARKLRSAVCRTRDGHPYKLYINPILKAKVPIIKIEDPVQDVKCDIATWRDQGSVSALFSKFCAIDERVGKLLVYIKYWSKRRGINDGKAMKLTSFAYALLSIKYLQLIGVIPVITSEEIPPWKSENRASLGQLLQGFFEFWYEFNWEKLEVSILTESIGLKDATKYDVRENQTQIIIADPIERRNNVGRNIRVGTLREFKIELKRGINCCIERRYDNLVKSRNTRGRWKTSVCGPIPPSLFMAQHYNGGRAYGGEWNRFQQSGYRRNRGGGWKRRRDVG